MLWSFIDKNPDRRFYNIEAGQYTVHKDPKNMDKRILNQL